MEKSHQTGKISVRWYLPALLFGIVVLLAAGCVSAGSSKLQTISLAPLGIMPDYVQHAAPEVKEAYRFAVANPEVLTHIPCYCGCNALGHRHNLDCYVKSFRKDGSVAEFDNHAAF